MKWLLAALALLLSNIPAPAQAVKAIIIQINSEQNKLRYLQKSGKNKEVENVAGEAMEARKKMITDFNDNFSYCPVYYYIDTNADLVKNKQFKNILLNQDGILVKAPIINSSDSDYLIVRYGYPDANTSVRNVKDLVIYTDKFTPLFRVHRHEPDKTTRKYVFISGKYDIDYYPAAKELNHTIEKRYEE